MQQWEYKVERIDVTHGYAFEDWLSNYGLKGWELICCNSVGRMYELIFKRVKE